MKQLQFIRIMKPLKDIFYCDFTEESSQIILKEMY
jgi:hypothetical protein